MKGAVVDERVDALVGAMGKGAEVYAKVNSRRGWTRAAERDLERWAKRSLRVVLGRDPTAEEVQALTACGD